MASEDSKVLLFAKKTECADAEGISNLIRKSFTSLFGSVDVVEIIEKSNFSLTLTEKNNIIVGQASFCNYPNVGEVDSSSWEKWISDHFNLPGIFPMNSLFLCFFAARDEYCLTAMNEILRIAFTALPNLQYIFLVVPPQSKVDIVFQHFFTEVQLKSSAPNIPPCTLRVAKRHKHYPALHIREAKVEDNDDIVPIFKQCNQNLDKQYGEFFIAEMIESQDKSHRTIVSEVNGLACGFASITTDVDMDVLNSCFDLEPFCGLCKTPTQDTRPEPSTQEASHLEPVASQVIEKHLSGTPQTSKVHVQETSSQAAVASRVSLLKQGSKKSPFATPTQSRTAMQEASSSKSQLLQSQKSRSSTAAIEPKLVETEITKSHITMQSSSVVEEGTKEDKVQDGRQVDMVGPSASSKVEFQDSQPGEGKLSIHSNLQCRKECSAVSIQLFAIDQKYEMRSVDFLPAIFSLFPDKDFIIITQPYSMPDFPLLNVFTRAVPHPSSSLSQELYVFHKCALLETFGVRFAVPSDLDSVQHLVDGTSHSETIVKDVENYLTAKRDRIEEGATSLYVLVATCLDQVVGVAVVRQEQSLDLLRAHYNIEDFVYFNYHEPEEHGRLHHFVLNPIFHCLGRHFLTEVLRHTHKTCLYYTLYPADEPHPEGIKPHTAVAALPLMVQVRPRRQVQYCEESLGVNAPQDEVLRRPAPFALYHINRKLTHEPKVQINARIVVVGASDTGISILETFVTANPHLQFNNLTLISPHGLLPKGNAHFLSNKYAYTVDDYHRMALNTWLNVVKGTVVQLDREEKQLVVVTEDGEETIISYEYLVFATGLQYCVEEGQDGQVPPSNVCALNDSEDEELIKECLDNLSRGAGKVVVYGSGIDVFTGVEGLLRQGIKGQGITVVHPHTPQCFNNPTVEGRVRHKMEEAGITIHCGYHLLHYNDGQTLEEDSLRSVTFTQVSDEDQQKLKIECSVMLCLHEKRVNSDVFRAVNGAYLVFDRRLVIDSDFQTNDPCIFAAGPLTKFSRRYHSEQWTHATFNSKEVGRKLAGTLLPIFDPLLTPPSEGKQDRDLIPSFHHPVIRSGRLPGGFNYLHVEKPNTGEPLAVMTARDDYGQELVTASSDSYFRIHVNTYNRVQTITCLNKEVMDTDNIVSLYGLHEKYLNNVVSRYNEKLIPDFYSFFKEPWAAAIFHDRFSIFREEIHELLQKRNAGDGKSFHDEVVEQLPEDLKVTSAKRDVLSQAFLKLPVKTAVEQHLLAYLAYNSYHLPMYARPNML
jgi:thioredoxin reductase